MLIIFVISVKKGIHEPVHLPGHWPVRGSGAVYLPGFWPVGGGVATGSGAVRM